MQMSATASLSPIQERRERVFLCLAGVFICAMTLLNVIGITRFVQLGPMALAVGVLPYPITFLCTDLISELYGKHRAQFVVSVGLVLNGFILAIMSLGAWLPSVPEATQAPWQNIMLAEALPLPNGSTIEGQVELFHLLYACTSGAVIASMLAYVAAQYVDVHLFHFWKQLTRGKHLWLRNNFSTLISQGVDSFMVVSVTFGALWLAGGISSKELIVLMGSNYLFKMMVALLDTLPLYWLVKRLSQYLQLNPTNSERV